MAQHRALQSSFPVLLPHMPELRLSQSEFDAFVKSSVTTAADATGATISTPSTAKTDTLPRSADQTEAGAGAVKQDANPNANSRFMDALLTDKAAVPTFDNRDGKMLTENADVAYRTSGEALVDAFYELEDVISSERLREVLDMAWSEDPEATLKIIWNARSIHLGKSSRPTFYRAVGWLAECHPLTLLANLPWVMRPLIAKKATPASNSDQAKSDGIKNEDAIMTDATHADSEFEIVDDPSGLESHSPDEAAKLNETAVYSEFDVKNGVAHGYWKDLLNILALAANDELNVHGNPRNILNVEKQKRRSLRDWTEGAKKRRIQERHHKVLNKLQSPFYKALHLTVARLFANQLKLDMARLASGSTAAKKKITLAGKWAPSTKGMHDEHTFIVSSIAEALYSFDDVCPETVDPADRESYLKYARLSYQTKTLSPLRKHLEIVEHHITTGAFGDIKYSHVPSLAMARYTPLFIKKDPEHFSKYLEDVASGKANISGATLLPSTLVSIARPRFGRTKDALVENKMREMRLKVIDGQWNTLVQRIKDNGTLESSIAVCDVSGSMTSPVFPDKTCPLDSAVGLSLLIAEITKPPFGGAFITFHEHPQVLHVGGPNDARSFEEKVRYICGSDWGGNTDFVAVFRRLILPLAKQHNLKQEEMVKQIFVFSDMQFDSASDRRDWRTSYERIKQEFADAGYEMPKLIFWNLAGGRAGYDGSENGGNDTAPKPARAADENTVLVSGYSQGQLKMFLENGQFEDPEEEVEDKEVEEGDAVVVSRTKPKQNPLAAVRKAISHEAYRMLKVMD